MLWLVVRIGQPAFHPDATQRVLSHGNPSVIAFERTSLDGKQHIFCLTNVAAERQSVSLPEVPGRTIDLLTGRSLTHNSAIELAGWETVWLTEADSLNTEN